MADAKKRLCICVVEEKQVTEYPTDNRERFSGDGWCKERCLDEILFFFNQKLIDANEIRNARSTSKIIKLLNNNGLSCFLYISKPFIISPVFSKYIFLKRYQKTFSLQHFEKFGSSIKKRVYLHHVTAHQLYKINEVWSHYICEFFDSDNRLYFDPFLGRLKIEYPNMENYLIPSHNQIVRKYIISILIWR